MTPSYDYDPDKDPGEPCHVCGLMSFKHSHPANSNPRDYSTVSDKMKEETPWYVTIYYKPGTTSHEALREIVAESSRRTREEILEKITSLKYGENPERHNSVMEIAYDLAVENILSKLGSQK